MPPRPFEPTEKQRGQVEAMSSYGIPEEEIALNIINPKTGEPITAKTLRKHFRVELDTGAPKANARVIESLFSQAVGVPAVFDSAGNKIRAEQPRVVAAAIFWAKARMGWREKSQVELSGENGGPIPLVVTKNQSQY